MVPPGWLNMGNLSKLSLGRLKSLRYMARPTETRHINSVYVLYWLPFHVFSVITSRVGIENIMLSNEPGLWPGSLMLSYKARF